MEALLEVGGAVFFFLFFFGRFFLLLAWEDCADIGAACCADALSEAFLGGILAVD